MGYDNRNGGYRSGGTRNSMGNGYKKAELPKGYLSGGYFETAGDEKVLKPEYIVKYSREIAGKLDSPEEWDKPNSPQNKRSQIRKFYEYVLGIQGLLRRKNNNFEIVEAELNRLVPFVNYARSRGTVSELFRLFIEENLKAVHGAEDLNAFAKHFESIVAYLPKEKN